jgi:hypothetical protein
MLPPARPILQEEHYMVELVTAVQIGLKVGVEVVDIMVEVRETTL